MDRRTLRVADLEVRLFGESPGRGERLWFDDLRVASAFVTRLMGDARDAFVLHRLAGELEHRGGEDVVTRLAGALVRGQLVVTRTGAIAPPIVGPPGEEKTGEHPGDEAFSTLQAGPPTHWVEVQLIGEDGEGIPGQRYRIITPDGVEWRGFTDSLGVARVNRIPDGICEVFFPDLDGEAWESVATSAGANAPPPADVRAGQPAGEEALSTLPPLPTLPRPEASTHWVEIQLVGEDGQGIPGQRYRLIAPDGVERRGFTDSLGVARVERIPRGTCKVSFPDLDAEAWEAI